MSLHNTVRKQSTDRGMLDYCWNNIIQLNYLSCLFDIVSPWKPQLTLDLRLENAYFAILVLSRICDKRFVATEFLI